MDTEAKKQFVRDLTQSMCDTILRQIDAGRIPEDWDGIEFRWLIAEHAENNTYRFGNATKKRKAEFYNTVLVNDL